MFYFLQSPLSPSLRAKRSNPVLPLPSLRAKRGNPVPRASNLGGRFTLPITPGIKFGGHFHLPDSSEVKFGGHSCIIDLSDTLIWGSSFPSPINFTPRSSQNQRAKANPLIYFLPPQEATTGSPRRNEVEVKRSWHEVPEGLSGSREGNSEGSGNLVPLPRLLFTFKLRSLL